MNSEAIIETVMTKASCLKKMPVSPPTNISGMNTATMVRVDAATASPTSEEPNTAAGTGLAPRSRWRVMFSRITMASSTTIPDAMAREESVMVFIV